MNLLKQAEEIRKQQDIVNSLANMLDNPAYYDAKIESKNTTIKRLEQEINDLRRERDNLPEALTKAERQLRQLKQQHRVASNPALKKLLRLKEQVAKLEKELEA